MQIKMFISDVDGTLTDSGIYYDDSGNELKKFSTKDAIGFYAVHALGMEIMILTGRECAATTRRMKELGADYIFQNIRNKREFLSSFMAEHGLSKSEVCYIGDDINDLPAMELAGYVGCPADSSDDVKSIADYVSPISGGYGAVRDVVEHLLRKEGRWSEALSLMYGIGN